MAVQCVKMQWIGVSPLLMHNGQLCDPLSKWAKASKQISSKKTKTDADHEMMARIEFMGGLYMGSDGPILPAENIEATMVASAKKVRKGSDTKAAVYCQKHSSLVYDGPREPESLWEDERFRSRVGVSMPSSGSRVMRTRPIFREWSAIIELEYEDEILNRSDVIESAVRAGRFVGIGDWRPRYGRFSVEDIV